MESKDVFDQRACEDLANAIVVQAIEDYVDAMVDKHQAEEKLRKAESMIIDCEKFLKSDWYKQLTKVESAALVEVARKQADYIIWQKGKGCPTCKHETCKHKIKKQNWMDWCNGDHACAKEKEREARKCSASKKKQ